MESTRPFRVVIVGGGIAGLTLAVMLEKFDIDYVLLEAHEEIAPPVGASIGLLPSGLLVLDQIGCYEPVKATSRDAALANMQVRCPQGKSLACTKDLVRQIELRHGYPLFYIDRQWLLQVLYDQIKHKDRIILRSRIETIEHVGEIVKATTTDKSVYEGHMIVGADGIKSVVRREMTRENGQTCGEPTLPDEEELVPCYYQCSFGIAQDVQNWPEGDLTYTAGVGQTFLLVSGPDRRCYWFLFKKLPAVKYGKDIPRYTAEDEAEFVKSNAHVAITENLTFEHVYAKRITSTLTPLHEFVFKKWFQKRMVIIGDSAHKPNPISGMGGNNAIESAAELVNAIVRVMKRRENGLNGLLTSDVEAISRDMQDARLERAKVVVDNAHNLQGLYAYEKPFMSKLIWQVVVPLTSGMMPLNMMSLQIVASARLEELPIPRRRRLIPFNHELPTQPIRSKPLKKTMQVIFLAAMAFTLFASTKSVHSSTRQIQYWARPTSEAPTWLSNDTVPHDAMASLSLQYSGTTSRVHELYALSQLISPILIYTIEGYRVGNQGTLLSLPSLFLFGIGFLGIGRVAPFYAIVSILQTSQSPAGRFVCPEFAKILIPALALGYLVLSISTSSNSSLMDWATFYQYIPTVFSPVTTLLYWAWKKWQQRDRLSTSQLSLVRFSSDKTEKQAQPESIQGLQSYRYDRADVTILRIVYFIVFAVQAGFHVMNFVNAYSHGYTSSVRGVGGLLNAYSANQRLQTPPSRVDGLYRSDLVLASLGYLGMGLFLIWDLRRQGYSPTRNAAKAAAAFVAGQVVFGPGAALAGLWSWRENVISGLSIS